MQTVEEKKQPELVALEAAVTPAAAPQDPYLVTFDSPSAPENPKNFSTPLKYLLTTVLSVTGFNRIMVSTIMAPALQPIATSLSMSPTESVMSLSIYLLATAFGPLFIGPLSEVYGRSVILHATNVWFLIWNLVCGFAKTKEVLIASRFLAGFGASAIYALGAGVLSDIWRPDQRGKSLGVYAIIPLIGAAVGPIIGGFMADRVSWRWIFYSTSIFQGVLAAACFFAFRETFPPLLLRRHAAKLNRESGSDKYQTLEQRQHADVTVSGHLIRALSRPVRLLLFHPIIQVSALISAFSYGLLYIMLASFSELYLHQYKSSVEMSGLHYIGLAAGELLASQLCGPLMDWYYRRQQRKLSSASETQAPESRIPLVFVPSLFVPVGLLIYGWSANYHVHWFVVDLGAFIVAFAGQMAGMPRQAYLIDAYSDHVSSAMASLQFLNSLTAFLFPLFTPTMYSNLGYGWGNTILAFLALFFGVPAPFILWKYGARLRMKAQSSF